MKAQQAKKLLMEGDELLAWANEEAHRPVEDTVSIAVCKDARESLRNYLHYFLNLHHIKPASQSIEDLHRQCVSVDPRFGSIDLLAMRCQSLETYDDEDYCLDAGNVANCLALANQVRQLIDSETDS